MNLNQQLKSSDVAGGYKPTQEELNKLKRKDWVFKVSGDWVFYTIQWEGQFTGRPTIFVRLSVCNLKCSRCDAWYTRRQDTKEFYGEMYERDIDELYIDILNQNSECRDITFTGGEPLLQQRTISLFVEKYGWYFDRIQIETNGTIPPLPALINNDKIFYNCSPKLSMSGNSSKLALQQKILQQLSNTDRAIFKFVFRNKEDLDEITQVYGWINKAKIWVMPEWVYVNEHQKVFSETIDVILSKWYSVAIRAQSIMRDAARRGV